MTEGSLPHVQRRLTSCSVWGNGSLGPVAAPEAVAWRGAQTLNRQNLPQEAGGLERAPDSVPGPLSRAR